MADGLRAWKIGNRAGDLQDAIVDAGREAQPAHHALEQALVGKATGQNQGPK